MFFLNEKTIWLEKNKNFISGTTVCNSLGMNEIEDLGSPISLFS